MADASFRGSSRRGLSGYLFMIVGVLLVAGAALGWYAAGVNYEASSLLKVSSETPGVLGRASHESPEGFAIYKRTQAQLVRSPLVLKGVLRDRSIPQLSLVAAHHDDPLAWLKRQLIIDYPDDAEIMRVSMTGSEPGELVKIVDRVVQSYFVEVVERERQQGLGREEKLRRAHEQQTSEYEKQWQALRNLEGIHKFSAQVANKQEELTALRAIKDRVGAQLDAAVIERLAPPRITLVEQAVVADLRGDASRGTLMFGGLAAVGLVLAGLGAGMRTTRNS